MAQRHSRAALLVVAGGLAAIVVTACAPAQPQAYRAPRTPDGTPDLSGIWQANNTANWDLEAHAARPGPVFALGAAFSVPAGIGVVDGDGAIPYRPEALEKKKENGEKWMTLDPEVKCFMPGIPRATYMPFPFRIVQGDGDILFVYEFASANRIVHMSNHEEPPVDSWMGWSNGRWDGNDLVIEVTGNNDQTWFDRAGNYHGAMMKVTERYKMVDKDHIEYTATIEDPETFERPWTISLPLYRRTDKNVQLLEFKCVEFSEELLYGDLVKKN